MIRKFFFYFMTFCFTISTYSQFRFEDIKGDWVSNKNQIISLKSWAQNSGNYLINNKGEELKLFLTIDGNLLSFQNHYFKDSKETFFIDKYDFQLQKITDSTLVLLPRSSLAESFFDTTKEIKFTEKSYLRNSKFKFEKLWFEEKMSALQKCVIGINANKEVDFKDYRYKYQSNGEDGYALDEKGFRKIEQDTVIKKRFQMAENEYEKLIRKLIESKISELNQQVKYNCSHCNKKSLMIYYNNEIFEYKEFGKTPYILQDLISLLKSFM